MSRLSVYSKTAASDLSPLSTKATVFVKKKGLFPGGIQRVYQLGMNWPGALKKKKKKRILVGSVGETTPRAASIRSCVAISAVLVIHAACHPSISG